MSITTDRIDLYTANVPAHLQYKEHTVLPIILPLFQNISLGRDFHYGSHRDVSRYILECRFTHFAPYVVHGGIYTKTCI